MSIGYDVTVTMEKMDDYTERKGIERNTPFMRVSLNYWSDKKPGELKFPSDIFRANLNQNALAVTDYNFSIRREQVPKSDARTFVKESGVVLLQKEGLEGRLE